MAELNIQELIADQEQGFIALSLLGTYVKGLEIAAWIRLGLKTSCGNFELRGKKTVPS